MKKNIILYLIVFLVLVGSNTNAQEVKTENENPNFYSTITIGAIEGFLFSLGKYFTHNFSAAVKFSMYGTRGDGLSTHAGIGIGGNYYFTKILIFEYLSADYIKIFESSHNGHAVEFTAGYNTNSKKGFGFIYELGVGYSDVKAKYSFPQYQHKTLLGPIIKIGLNYNLS